MNQKKIQNSIQKFRQEKSLTQEELAIRIGVTRQTIISVEKGNYTPSLKLALELAQVFNKKIEDVFWFE